MIKMIGATLDLVRAGADLIALDELLMRYEQLNETGAGGLQEFFTAHPDLLLLLAYILFPGMLPSAYLPQCSIMHEFRADYAVANQERSKFLFVEFEHAKRNSIFSSKAITKANQSYRWSPSFERGFSQIIDWYYRLDDIQKSNKIGEHFGAPAIKYVGVLIIGRDKFLQQAGLVQRFEWRRRHTIINGLRLEYFTFDELANELKANFNVLADLTNFSESS